MRGQDFAGVCAIAILIATVVPALAETATEVQSWCRPMGSAQVLPDGRIRAGTKFEDGFCWGAFASMQELGNIVHDNEPLLLFCAPVGSTRVQWVQIFLKYTDQHPEQGQMAFGGVARRALADAFPCRPVR
jgi:hypothetical protein